MLTLKRFEIAHWPFGKILVFSSPEKALGHLCDHVLTRPEAQFWAGLIPSFTDLLDVDDDSLFRFARALWSGRPPLEVAQRLYEGYGELLAQAASEALALGWFWVEARDDGPCYRGIGTSGVFVIWQAELIRTGMLPGYAAPPGAEAGRPRRTDPLPRQHAWVYRGANRRRDPAPFPPVPGDTDLDRYNLFKRCAVRVRKEFKTASLLGKVADGGARMGSLRDHVPDFSTWCRLRRPLHAPPRTFTGEPAESHRYN